MALSNLDTTQGNPSFAKGVDHNVVRESQFAALAPTIAKAGAEVYDSKLGSDAGKLTDKVYQAGTKTDGTHGSFADIVASGEDDAVFAPYMRRLRELKAENAQGIKSTDAVAITLEAMLKEAANSNPAMYEKLLEKTQQTLGYDPTGTLLRVQERNTLDAQAQKESDARDTVKWYMKQSQVEPTIAKARVEEYLSLLESSDFNNPSEELKSDPVYKTHRLVTNRQVAQDRAATSVSRLNNMNALKNISAEKFSTEISSTTDALVLANLRVLAQHQADYSAAILSGNAEKAEEIRMGGLKLAKENQQLGLSISQNLSTMRPEFLLEQGFIDKLSDMDKLKRSSLYRALQQAGEDMQDNPLTQYSADYLKSFSNTSTPAAAAVVNNSNQAKATHTFMLENRKLYPLIALAESGVPTNAAQDIVIGQLTREAINNRDSVTPSLVIEATNKKLSSIYTGQGEPADLDTKTLQYIAAQVTDGIASKKTSTEYSKDDLELIANTSAVIEGSKSLPIREQRDLFKQLSANPALVLATVNAVVPQDASVERREIILDKLTNGAKEYKADIVDALIERADDGDIDPSTQYVYVSNGNVVARNSNRGIPSRKERSSNIMLNELHNSSVTLGILNNSRYSDIDSFTLDDGTVVDDPMTKLHVVLNTRAYGLKRPKGIAAEEYDALVTYIRTGK